MNSLREIKRKLNLIPRKFDDYQIDFGILDDGTLSLVMREGDEDQQPFVLMRTEVGAVPVLVPDVKVHICQMTALEDDGILVSEAMSLSDALVTVQESLAKGTTTVALEMHFPQNCEICTRMNSNPGLFIFGDDVDKVVSNLLQDRQPPRRMVN